MRNKKEYMVYGLIFLILAMSSIFGVIFLIQPTTISSIAEKDSSVSSFSSTFNYDKRTNLVFGIGYLERYEVYLYFNFLDNPVGWTKAEISIYLFSISETFDATVSLINDNWHERHITWENKPEYGETITTFTVVEKGFYKFDVTDYIKGNGISICLNASNEYQEGYACIDFREGYWFWAQQEAPQLIWTYEPDLTGLIIVIVILSIIGVVAIIGIYKHRKSKKKNELIPRQIKKGFLLLYIFVFWLGVT